MHTHHGVTLGSMFASVGDRILSRDKVLRSYVTTIHHQRENTISL